MNWQVKPPNKNKAFKINCQKHTARLQKMKSTQSEMKQIKIGKRPGTTIVLGVKTLHIILGHKK